ncbi:unnamed protein product [Cylicostephanus goldi]|uniref:Uncharacterized protein n=1 Tax=Cylicostephanus goldi TaxID=71465 RepID=A0A3P6QVB0_CYLGO|nr:unnamed protein product [Cylicostephanus goldi]
MLLKLFHELSGRLRTKNVFRTQEQSSEKTAEPVDSKTGDTTKGKIKEVREGETQDVTSDIEEPDAAEKQNFDDYLNALGEIDNDKNINKIIQNTMTRDEKDIGNPAEQQPPLLRNTMENVPVMTRRIMLLFYCS